jgi:hypothetical protein
MEIQPVKILDRTLLSVLPCLLLVTAVMICVPNAFAQGVSPYPDAITDNLVYQETPMSPPPVNQVFTDPDFGSTMVRATDQTTNFIHPGSYIRTAALGEANEWSLDASKFYVVSYGGLEMAFAFNPTTMAVSSLPGAKAGQGLILPLRPGSAFSFVDSDLIYGTTNLDPLTITSYRFSTATSTPVIDTTTCGTQPPLALGKNHSVVSDDDTTLSTDDSRVVISEGGSQSGKHPFVVVYDKKLGCRWYNTQTGQIGGQWGATGQASVTTSYLIRHTAISGSGKYVRIEVNNFGSYFWDLATLNLIPCPEKGGLECGGYATMGRDSYVNASGKIDQMNILLRPVNNPSAWTPLVYPLTPPFHFGQEKHFVWTNGYFDETLPVCGTSYEYDGDTQINAPYDNEIFCVETDGFASTVWRFAHHRAQWIAPIFNTQPLGNLSPDGRNFLFTSGWDQQLGNDPSGKPRSDVWIVRLD